MPEASIGSVGPQPTLAGRLAFDTYADIFVLDLPGGAVTQLTDDLAPEMNPVWSPDVSQIAYRSKADGNDDIFVMDADGSRQRNLSRTPERSEWGPTWSPDGQWIAFNASKQGGARLLQVFVVRPDGSEGHFLSTSFAEFPAWSPVASRSRSARWLKVRQG